MDPALGTGTMFAGSPNGGIWKTTDMGANWTPLTDNQASLSIGSLSLDPTDPTGKTIVAGIGLVDNGEYGFTLASRGGPRNGLLYSTDGGTTWQAFSFPMPQPESVVSALARGNTILAATFETQAAGANSANYGLYRSTDRGASFTTISGNDTSGLPAGAVTSLVADPNDPTMVYAAVKDSTQKGATSVYSSHNTGASWTQIFSSANTNLISSSGDPTAIQGHGKLRRQGRGAVRVVNAAAREADK